MLVARGVFGWLYSSDYRTVSSWVSKVPREILGMDRTFMALFIIQHYHIDGRLEPCSLQVQVSTLKPSLYLTTPPIPKLSQEPLKCNRIKISPPNKLNSALQVCKIPSFLARFIQGVDELVQKAHDLRILMRPARSKAQDNGFENWGVVDHAFEMLEGIHGYEADGGGVADDDIDANLKVSDVSESCS